MVDIVIRAKNGHALTARCMASIVANTPEGEYRIILVDDGSDPAYSLVELPGGDILIRSEASRGAVTATNLGLSVSLLLGGKYVMVLDNDTEIPSGDVTWLSRFISELEEYPGTAAVGAVTNFAKQVQHALGVPSTYTADWNDDMQGRAGTKENPPVAEFVSFAVLLRKEAVAAVGFWDERYNPGNYEDTDYAVALRKAGWTVRVARSVYIHHRGHATFSVDIDRLLAENGAKFVAKWGPGQLWDMGLLPDLAMRQVLSQRGRP